MHDWWLSSTVFKHIGCYMFVALCFTEGQSSPTLLANHTRQTCLSVIYDKNRVVLSMPPIINGVCVSVCVCVCGLVCER